MPRDVQVRPLKLEKYGISDYAYRELFYFCRQHREKQRKALERPSERLCSDIALLEQLALETAGQACYKALIANVVDGMTYDIAMANFGIPAGKEKFYQDIRRRFFCELAKAKGIT